jgi:BirA family biotin operon repressor/biotin-[acetyl-CoA-carboxylase] ligase
MWRLETYDSLGSTSDLCRERAAAGEPAGLAVMARRQEQGRGSFGRAWSSPQGNLYLSVLLRPDGSVRDGGLWSLLASVALADAVAPLLPDSAALRLKWPNDLLLDGAKLAGILLDSTARPDGDFATLVIGLGLNLATKPNIADRPVACVADHAPPPAPEAVAATLLGRLAHWTAVRDQHGFGHIRTAWLARSIPLATPLLIRQGSQDLAGAFAGLADDGSLLLETNGTRRAFAAGEVRLQANG